MTKKFDLSKYKESIKVADTPLKKDKFIVLNDALQEVLGLPGVPLSHVVQIFGKSDSGKTSLMFHIAAQAQKQNVLPIFIITEGKVSWDRAKSMGVDIDNSIIEYVDFLEDIFTKIDRYIADVNTGKLPMDIVILVDSIGNTVSVDSVKTNKDGTTEMGGAMMKASKVIREKMRIFSHKINDSRKISSPYDIGLVFINHAYTQPPQFPGGPSSLVPYGGDGIWLASSLVLRTKKSRNLTAIKDSKKIGYGIISKITVDKNHISNISNSGEFVITADSIIPDEKGAIEEYKASHKDSWVDILDYDNGENYEK